MRYTLSAATAGMLSVIVAYASTDSTQKRHVEELLARVSTYVHEFETEIASVVSEEHYWQSMRIVGSVGSEDSSPRQVVEPVTGSDYSRPSSTTPLDVMKSRVELVSDVLLVQVPGMTQWVPFRDVFKVDGKLIRDREDRLLDLFLDGSENAVEQALSITKESARFNIGPVDRTINVPTLALFFVSDQNRSRFEFKEQGRETIDGLSAWKLEYRERGRPTLVRTHRGENLPAAGAFWLDPTTGAVLQTELRTSGFGVRSKVVVTYTFEPTLGLRVPVEMVERYQVQGGMRRTEGAWTRLVATGDTVVIDAKATYDRFRRFSVDVDERLLKFIR